MTTSGRIPRSFLERQKNMFDEYNWQKVEGAPLEPFLKLVNPIQGTHNASAATATVGWCQLPFYTTIGLVRVQDTAWPAGTGPFWFLAKQGRMFLLDGSSAPIHDANEADPIKVVEANVLDYLRFFCYFVHGDEGPFLIVEDVNHDAIDQTKLEPGMRKVIEDAVRLAKSDPKPQAADLLSDVYVAYR